jgi:hypothetical protein
MDEAEGVAGYALISTRQGLSPGGAGDAGLADVDAHERGAREIQRTSASAANGNRATAAASGDIIVDDGPQVEAWSQEIVRLVRNYRKYNTNFCDNGLA